MRRICICVCLALALSAISVRSSSAVTAADTLASPVKTDTIQAGGWTITGEVQKPSEGVGISTEEREQLKSDLLQLGSNEVPGLRRWQRRKNPTVAWLSSVVLPGLGQLYNGRRIKVGLAAGFFSVYAAGAWLHRKDAQSWTAFRDNLPEDAPQGVINNANDWITFHKETARDFLWWTGAIWLIVQLDAWIDAHLYDLRVYSPPAPVVDSSIKSPAESRHYLTLSIDFH